MAIIQNGLRWEVTWDVEANEWVGGFPYMESVYCDTRDGARELAREKRKEKKGREVRIFDRAKGVYL